LQQTTKILGERFTEKVILELRNKEGLIRTLEMPFVKEHRGNIFLLWGRGHFYDGEVTRELKEYLNQYPHWIGFPK